jgi:hypothetical protein
MGKLPNHRIKRDGKNLAIFPSSVLLHSECIDFTSSLSQTLASLIHAILFMKKPTPYRYVVQHTNKEKIYIAKIAVLLPKKSNSYS